MKRLILLFTASFCTAGIASAQIPNASFENWVQYTTSEFPSAWTTSDSLTLALGAGSSAFKGTDPFDGTHSLHLKSTQVPFPSLTGPGIATNGTIALSGVTFTFSDGSPHSTRSRIFTGQYKYIPANPNDAAVVTVALLRGINRDTVASGRLELTGQQNNYTFFQLDLNYQDWINDPDTCLIILQSSRNINDPNLGVGSEFVVDSLGFSGTVGINELTDVVKSVSIYPAPATDYLNLDIELKKNMELSYEIYSTRGELVMHAALRNLKEQIDISRLSAGNYILKLKSTGGQHVYSETFGVTR